MPFWWFECQCGHGWDVSSGIEGSLYACESCGNIYKLYVSLVGTWDMTRVGRVLAPGEVQVHGLTDQQFSEAQDASWG